MYKTYITALALILSLTAFAQETKKDTLKTEEIIVVKPYTPTISDAFKVQSNPTIEESDSFQKEAVTYSIFSIPVASTFTPSKGKAKGVTRAAKERLFDNYITAGFGNFKTPLLEAYIHYGEDRYYDFGVFANHHSSEGGIKDQLLDDAFSDSRLDLYYKQFENGFDWQLNAGAQRQQYNYYGIPNNVAFSESYLQPIDEEQTYTTVYGGGKINFEESFIKGATAELINFSDAYSSNELQFLVKPKIEFPISEELINAAFLVDFVSGKFKQTYIPTSELKHSYLNLGVSPNLEILRDNFTLNLGAKLVYANDLHRKTNTFYAYPNVNASYKLVDDIFILFAGATGDLVQNTYRDFVEENPYVSPTLNVLQTDQQYKAFAGAKGKLASNIGYNITVSHTSEKNKPLFVQNAIQTEGITSVTNAYQLGNSFGVVYDDLKTLGIFGEITIEASKEFNFSASLTINDYTTSTQMEAWNLPTTKATISGKYQNDKWFAGAKLFYRGKTKDYIIPFFASSALPTIHENDSYLDLNLSGGYNLSDRLTVFARINNAMDTKYHRFVNYQVQPLQILGGLTYKFDL